MKRRILSYLLIVTMIFCMISGTMPSFAQTETGKIQLNYETLEINLENIYETPLYLTNGYYTESSANGKIDWKSSDESVAIVSSDGRVKALKEGNTTITGAYKDAPTQKASCEVTVYKTNTCNTFYYVSPTGSDENNGSESSPFKTVTKARDTIRGLSDIPTGGITVILEDGKYYTQETIEFTPEDSGTRDNPIIYKARNQGKAIITGEVPVTGWKLADQTDEMSSFAKGKVYVADIEKGWRFHDLYVNGERQQVSRSFNTGNWRDWPIFYGRAPLSYDSEKGARVVFGDGELDGLNGKTDVEVVLLSVMYWNSIPVLNHIDSANKTAYLQSKVPSNFWTDHFGTNEGYYNIINALKFLDVPGEWCVDSMAGKVYYWPADPSTINTDTIVAPKPYELLRLKGNGVEENFKNLVENITFNGISFQYTDRLPETQFPDDWIIRNAENPDAAVYFDGAQNCKVINSEVKHSGTYGIMINHYGQRNEILHNQLSDLGSGGVQLFGYGVGTTDVNKQNIVMFNSIYKMGVAPYQHSPGISVFGSGSNTLAYNYIAGAPYAGISIVGTDENSVSKTKPNTRAAYDLYGNQTNQYGIRFNELEALPESEKNGVNGEYFTIGRLAEKYQHSERNVAEYNILDDYSQSMDDGGALYSWYSGLGNVYAYNILKEELQGQRTWVFRLYMDNCALGFTLEKNLCSGNFNATVNKSFAPYNNKWIGNDYAKFPAVPAGYADQRQKILDNVSRMAGGFNLPASVKPRIIYPENGNQDVQIPTTIKWNHCENASVYKLEIATDEAFTNIVETIETQSTVATTGKLDFNTVYYARVTTREYLQETQISDVITFKTAAQTAPADIPRGLNISNDVDAVVIQWDPIAKTNVNVYRKGETDADFVKIASNIPGKGYLDSSVEPQKTYSYKVAAVNPAGEGPLSEAMSISTRDLEILFSDNFDDGTKKPDWKMLNGTSAGGSVVNGKWIPDGSWKEYFVQFDNKNWDDYAVEAEITFDSLQPTAESYSGFGLITRASAPRKFYQFIVRTKGTQMEFLKCNGNNWSTLQTIQNPQMPVPGTVYKMRAEQKDGLVRMYLDGILVAETYDETYAYGGIGIGYGKDNIKIDNVRVVQPKRYSINVNQPENGNINVDKSTAVQGEAVTVTVAPADNYNLKEGSLKINGKPLAGTLFVMPAEPVTITAEFVQNTAENVASRITEVSSIHRGQTRLVLPNVAEGFSIAINSSDNTDVISLDGTITPAAEEKEVNITFIVKDSTGEDTAVSKSFAVIVPPAIIYHGPTFYVAENGDDAASGDLDHPLATIQAAKDIIRQITEDGMTEDMYVYVREGTYYLDEAIELNELDSGKNGHTITYMPYNNESVRIVGGEKVTSEWTSYQGDIMQTNIGAGKVFWELVVDGQRMNIARSNDFGKYNLTSATNLQAVCAGSWFGEVIKVKSINGAQYTLDYPIGGYSGYVNQLQGAKEFISKPGDWAVDSDNGILYYWPLDGQNVDECEVIIPTTGNIFKLKGSDESNLVENVIIKGFTLDTADFGPSLLAHSGHMGDTKEYDFNIEGLVHLEYTNNIKIQDCKILNAGYVGVSIRRYGQNNEVSGCRIENSGYAGIFLIGDNPGSLNYYNKKNTITNNLILNSGNFVNHGAGIYLINSGDNEITHNNIDGTPRYAISYKGIRYGAFKENGLPNVSYEDHYKYNQTTNNLIAYNMISNVGKGSGDGGGIESWGGGRDNIIDHNIIVNAYASGTPTAGWRGHSIFLDDGVNYTRLTNNIIYDESAAAVNAGVYLKGIGNVCENNVVDVTYQKNGAAEIFPYIEPAGDQVFSKNIIYADGQGVINPDGSNTGTGAGDRNMWTYDDNGIKSMREMDYNVYWNTNGGIKIAKWVNSQNTPSYDWLGWSDTFDQNSRAVDPKFVDASNRDYRLTKNSPAYELGIKSIDTSGIGLLPGFKYASNDSVKMVYVSSNESDNVYQEIGTSKIQLETRARTEKFYPVDMGKTAVTYESDNTSIATVDQNGLVTFTKTGEVTITATVEGKSGYVTLYYDEVLAAKAAVAGASYEAMAQSDATDEAEVSAYIEAIAVAAVNNSNVNVTVNKESYTPAIAGTEENPSGTNGSYVFTVTVAKDGVTETIQSITLTITATAYSVEYSISIDDTIANGTLELDKANANEGEIVVITVKPANGYKLLEGSLKHTIDGVNYIQITGNSFNMPAGDVTVTAEFEEIEEPQPQEFTVTITQGANGTITSNAVTVTSGGSIELTFTPDAGYKVKSTTVNGENVTLADGKYTVNNVQSDITVAAEFEKIEEPQAEVFTVTITQGANGTITSNAATVTSGGSIELIFTPNTGYRIKSATVNGAVVTLTGGKYTVTNVQSNVAVTAEFELINQGGNGGGNSGPSITYYTITATSNHGGKVSPGSATVEEKGSKTFTITADEGYEISDVEVDGNSVGKLTTYTFDNVTGNHTLKATFKKIEVPEKPEYKNPFTDIDKNHWFYDSVMYVYNNGLMSGFSTGRFNPLEKGSRGMIVTILYTLEGRPDAAANSFKDVEAGKWYTGAIEWAAENNIVSGHGNGLFGPNENITREQMAAIFYNYAKFKGYDLSEEAPINSFTDSNKVSNWANEAMQWMVGSGMMSGKGNNILDPKGTATRAEMASIMQKFAEKYSK